MGVRDLGNPLGNPLALPRARRGDGGSGGVGTVRIFPEGAPDSSWIAVDGSAVGVEEYPKLYDAIGNSYWTWNAEIVPPAAPEKWIDIAYGNGIFLAVAWDSLAALSRDRGKTWEVADIPVGTGYRSVGFGDGIFLINSRTSGAPSYVFDGSFFTEAPWGGSIDGVAHGNGRFVGISSDQVRVSEDGFNWTTYDLPSSQQSRHGIAFGGGVFAAVGRTNNIIITSEDGVSWSSVTGAAHSTLNDITYGPDGWVAVGGDISDQTDIAVFWKPGSSPILTTLPFSAQWTRVQYGGGVYVALPSRTTGSRRRLAAYSMDGVNWHEAVINAGDDLEVTWGALTYGEGTFVALSGANITVGNLCARVESMESNEIFTLPPAPINPTLIDKLFIKAR